MTGRNEPGAGTILIVEDDPGIAELIKLTVEETGREAAHVAKGLDAINWLEKNIPELLILDYSLPDMKAADILDRLSAKAAPIPPFIVATGAGDERIAVDMMKRGARDYVIKDSSFVDVLPNVLNRTLRQIAVENELTKTQDELREKTLEIERFFTLAIDLLFISDLQGVIRRVNPEWEKILGLELNEIEGKNFLDFLHPDDIKPTQKALEDMIQGKPVSGFSTRIVASDGKEHFIEWRAMPYADLIYAAAHDVSERIKMEAELYRLATTDALTGIYNRRMALEIGNKELLSSKRHSYSMSVFMMDIDHFKKINDNYGHAAGDEVLRSVVNAGKNGIRAVDNIGRMGGEEFVVILPQTSMEDALVIAERLRVSVEHNSVNWGGNIIYATVSIGVSVCREEDNNIEEVLIRADRALYQAKEKGRNRVESSE